MVPDPQPTAEGAAPDVREVRTQTLVPKPLKPYPFTNYGSVVELGQDPALVGATAGQCVVKIVTLMPRERIVTEFSRHNHTAIVWIPMDRTPYMVVVGPKMDEMLGRQFPGTNEIRAFHTDGHSGVLINAGVWSAEPFVTKEGRFVAIAFEPADVSKRDDLTRNYEEILRTRFKVEEPDPNEGVRLL